MFYYTFHKLCESKGVTDSRACLEMGFSRSYAAKMKNKNGAPSMDKLSTMAEYFGVTVDYLLNAEKENPTAQGDGVDTITEKEVRMLKWFRSLPEEKRRAILISQDAPKDLLD